MQQQRDGRVRVCTPAACLTLRPACRNACLVAVTRLSSHERRFILVTVIYVLFATPYVLAFLAYGGGKDEQLWPVRDELSQVCQTSGDYAGFIATHAADTAGYSEEEVQYAMLLPRASAAFTACNTLVDVVFFADIALSFVTGYTPQRASEPRYDLHGIVLHYLRGSLALDVVATVPWNWVRAGRSRVGHVAGTPHTAARRWRGLRGRATTRAGWAWNCCG